MRRKSLNRIRVALLGMAMAGFLAIAADDAGAEEVDAAGIPQQINLYDVILKYPQPAWISGRMDRAALLARSEFFKEQVGPRFIFEQIPAGQTFDAWKSLYAVVAEELRAGQAVPMGTFIDLSVEQNRLACATGAFGVQTVSLSDDNALVVMICGSTENGPQDIGYGPDVGELSVWRFIVFENTYLKLYHRWRGAAFRPDNRTDWPVSDPNLQEMVRKMADEVEVHPNLLRREPGKGGTVPHDV